MAGDTERPSSDVPQLLANLDDEPSKHRRVARPQAKMVSRARFAPCGRRRARLLRPPHLQRSGRSESTARLEELRRDVAG